MWRTIAIMLAATGLVGAEDTKPSKEGIALFNGKNLSGWKLFVRDQSVDPNTVWKVEDGIVRCTGNPPGFMMTEKSFENYVLEFEWRWPDQGGNSGLLVHAQGQMRIWPQCIESQLQSEHAGDLWVIGTDFREHTNKDDRRVAKRKEHNEKPLGEWNVMKVVCRGDTIEVYVNGLLQNVATETTVTKGQIGFQSEGTPIDFRKIVLKPLAKEKDEQS